MKTTSAFLAVVTAIISLLVFHGSEAADAAQYQTAIRPFSAPTVPQNALDDLRRLLTWESPWLGLA